LQSLADWDPYLLAESGLPGPRGNLELAHAAAWLADEARLARWRELDPQQAPVNNPLEFLALCGVLGLGRRLTGELPYHPESASPEDAAGSPLALLRAFSADPRWRVREAVAMALQAWGAADLGPFLDELLAWAGGNPFEQRAAVAAICEPAVLKFKGVSQAMQGQIFDILDRITAAFAAAAAPERRSEGYQALKKGLAYGWSVAVAYLPGEGKPRFERWFTCPDRDLGWVLRENLKKNRLERLDPEWVAYWTEHI
jgi:hypothetical protein